MQQQGIMKLPGKTLPQCVNKPYRETKISSIAFQAIVVLVLSLLIGGCSRILLVPEHPAGDDVASAAARYLEANLFDPAFGGRVFCAADLLYSDQQGSAIKAYVWVLCIEYYEANQTMLAGTAVSEPLLVYMIEFEGSTLASGYAKPRDGSLFAEDIERMFPAEAVECMCLEDILCKNARVERLEAGILDQVTKVFIWPIATRPVD